MIKKEEQEPNDLAKGPRSRTEQNDFKKVGMCPALDKAQSVFSGILQDTTQSGTQGSHKYHSQYHPDKAQFVFSGICLTRYKSIRN